VTRSPGGIQVRVTPLRRLNSTERRMLTAAAQRYEQFLKLPVAFSIEQR